MTIVGSGNERFSPTNLPQVARAVTSVLSNPEKTANKYLVISSFTTTQNEILGILEDETETKWTVKRVTNEEVERAGDNKKSHGDFTYFVDYLKLYSFADGAGHELKDSDSANGLLGLGEEDLTATLKSALRGD